MSLQSMAAAIGLAPLMMLGNTTTIQSSICQTAIDTPVITTVAQGSSVAAGQMYVGGTSSAQTQVKILLNNQVVAQTTASLASSFGATISVAAGSHSVSAEASDACTSRTSTAVSFTATSPAPNPEPGPSNPAPVPTPTQKPSPAPVQSTRTVKYTQTTSPPSTTPATEEPLVLSIDSALDGHKTEYSSIYVSGKLSRDGRVKIMAGDKVLAESRADSKTFGFTIPLNVGANEITVHAESGSASVEKNLTITRLESRSRSAEPLTGTSGGTASSDDTSTDRSPWYEGMLSYMIIGGGIALLLVIIGGFWWIIAARRRRKKEEES